MTQLAQVVTLLHDLGQTLRRRIRGAVVHIDDFIGPTALQRGGDLSDQRPDILRFVANDDGDCDLCVGDRQ